MSKISLPSVQSILIKMQFEGQLIATGSAFIVTGKTKPLLITNRHNLTGRRQDNGKLLSKNAAIPNEISIIHNEKGNLGNWIEVIEPLYDKNDSPMWIEHPRYGAKADFVALPLTNTNGVGLYPYNLKNKEPEIFVGPSDYLSVVGFPFGFQAGGSLAVWATGFMASEPEIDIDSLPIFLVDCRTRKGQSGAAVIAHRNGGDITFKDGSTAMISGNVT